MKRILIISLTFILSVMAISSCTKVLDQSPDGRVTLDDVFRDNDMTSAYLSTCYSYVAAHGLLYNFDTNHPTALSDEAWESDDCAGLTTIAYYNGNVSASNNVLGRELEGTGLEARMGKFWEYGWEAIRYCNIFLGRIDGATVTNPLDRNRWKAEAYVLRASYYLELLKWYGACFPLSVTPYDMNYDYANLKMASYGNVVKQIIADCQTALDMNSLAWRGIQGDGMRVTNAVAEAIKIRALLYITSQRYYDESYTLQEAYQIASASLANLRAHGYELFNKDNTFPVPVLWTEAFNDAISGPNKAALINAAGANKFYFCNWADYSTDPTDKETIWQHQVPDENYWNINIWFSTFRCGICPAQQYVDAFEVTDGTVAYPILNPARPYLDDEAKDYTNLEPNYNPAALTGNGGLYNPEDPYKNRDPRFYATVYYHGAKRYMADMNTGVQSWYTLHTHEGDPDAGIRNGDTESNRTFTRTGYYSQKFLHPTAGPAVGNQTPVQAPGWKIFRLGEMILNVAEMAIEAGNYADAIPLINEIRKRSAMPAVSASDQNTARQLLRQERRIELGFEESRYFDVRRWLPKGEDQDLRATDKWVGAMFITDNGVGTNPRWNYERRTVRVMPRECYTNKYLLQPIPQAEANRLESFTGRSWQNPGW